MISKERFLFLSSQSCVSCCSFSLAAELVELSSLDLFVSALGLAGVLFEALSAESFLRLVVEHVRLRLVAVGFGSHGSVAKGVFDTVHHYVGRVKFELLAEVCLDRFSIDRSIL